MSRSQVSPADERRHGVDPDLLAQHALRRGDGSRADDRYWDAAILEAARVLGCDRVLSEDLSHGEDYAGVRVVNPFVNH